MTLSSNRPLVYMITSGVATDDNIQITRLEINAAVKCAVDAGVSLIQIREKNISARNLYELTLELVEIVSGSDARLLVNDRADIAAAAGADGVHLTSRSLTAEVVRASFGAGFVVGVSAHLAEDVVSAAAAGADFAVLGPIFATPNKPHPIGVGELSKIVHAAGSLPVLALGGIDASNFRSVVDAGAAGFAAIRSLNDPRSLSDIMKKVGMK
ncbi:MAG: thiamine phosphate synthase [Acidobacteria bacterium]|nr:thiamine phosphate synthase [Acidobacteriota bacterium]